MSLYGEHLALTYLLSLETVSHAFVLKNQELRIEGQALWISS